MNLSEEVDLEDYVSRPDKISAAEVGPSYLNISAAFCFSLFLPVLRWKFLHCLQEVVCWCVQFSSLMYKHCSLFVVLSFNR